MACMTHTCLECGELWFDNKGAGFCPNPRCRSENVAHDYDEPEHDDDRPDDEEDEAEEAEDDEEA